LFKSADGGASWREAVNSGLPEGIVDSYLVSLVIDPQNTSTIYAAIYSSAYLSFKGGIYKSTDEGANWKLANSGLEAAQIFGALTMDPKKPGTLYAATLCNVKPCDSAGVFKSTDGAASWVAASSGLPAGDTFVDSFAIDPQNPDTIYATPFSPTTGAGQVFKSTDAGVSWNPASSGLPASPRSSWRGHLLIDPQNPSTVYTTIGNGVYKTTDGGMSWRPAISGLPVTDSYLNWGSFATLAIDLHNSSTLYATTSPQTGSQVFKSIDGGASWVNTGFPNSFRADGLGLAIDPQDSSTVYVFTPNKRGIFKSTDGANSWTEVNSGLQPTHSVNSFAVDARNPGTLYAGTDIGLFKTTNGGASWAAANAGLPPQILSLAIDPKNASVVYARGGDTFTVDALGGVFKSTDGGVSWNAANSGLEGYPLGGRSGLGAQSLLIDPQDPSTLYLPDVFSRTAGYAYLFKSTDGAVSWAPIGGAFSPSDMLALAIDPQNSSTLYAGGLGAFKSTDGGATWIAFRLPPEAYNEDDEEWVPIISLAVDPQNSSIVYASGSGGVFKSMDGGASWNAMKTGLIPKPQNWDDGNHSLVIDPVKPNNVYASAWYYGVVKSTDGGASWSAANSGLPSGTFLGQFQSPVLSLALDPQNRSTVYAATGYAGVFAITFAPDPPSYSMLDMLSDRPRDTDSQWVSSIH
jgi:photosystem II stability/assembly factor-like uncharacterized protein